MRQDNIFKVGDVVEGDSLIGYEEDYRKLCRAILYNKGNLALVGLHRMGKTSLMKKMNNEVKNTDTTIIPIFINLQEVVSCDSNSRFDSLLTYIAEELKENLERRLDFAQCDDLNYAFGKFEAAPVGSMTFRTSFKKLFAEIKNLNLHVLLSLDEFDSAEEIFRSNADYELFRSLADPSYALSLVFISRRRLYMIEKKNENNSTFHSTFPENPLVGFSNDDVRLLFETLEANYDIRLSPDQKARIRYYAGRSPFIYSAFCHEIVEEKFSGKESFDPDELYKKNITSKLTDYAEVLFKRLKTDGHLPKLLGILFGPSLNVTRSDKDLLFFMGYLSDENTDGDYYLALSGYFTDFLRNRYFADDSWKNIIAVEKLMKSLVVETYPSFDEEQWHELMTEAYAQIFGSEKKFNCTLYKNYIRNNRKIFDKISTLPEVLSLSDVFTIIQFRWNDFKKYFGLKSFEEVQEKFELCAVARNPLAHGHEEYLTRLQQERVNIYCAEILELVQKCRRDLSSTNPNSEVVGVQKGISAPSVDVQISRNDIGKVGILTDISLRKNGGLKGKIFGIPGTLSKAFLPQPASELLDKELQVEIIDINPQGKGYLLRLIEFSR